MLKIFFKIIETSILSLLPVLKNWNKNHKNISEWTTQDTKEQINRK